jgi:hypothetical protein
LDHCFDAEEPLGLEFRLVFGSEPCEASRRDADQPSP